MNNKVEFIQKFNEVLKEFELYENMHHISYVLYHLTNKPNLYYHNYKHVLNILHFAEKENIILEDYQKLAIFFHDAIYNPKNKDNEIKSSLLLTTLFSSENIDKEKLKKSSNIIMDTEKHFSNRKVFEYSEIVLDLDLSSFCQDFNSFNYDSIKIKTEYNFVPHNEFIDKRKKLLESLLYMRTIFRTEYFISKYDNIARDNIKEYLSRN